MIGRLKIFRIFSNLLVKFEILPGLKIFVSLLRSENVKLPRNILSNHISSRVTKRRRNYTYTEKY